MAHSAVDQQAGGSGFPEPTSSAIWTPSVVSSAIWTPSVVSSAIWTPSVMSSATTAPSVVPPAVSTVRELDAPAAIYDALIWCASASASEALLAASISRRSFFLAHASSSARTLRFLALSRVGGGGISEVENSATNTVSSPGSTNSGTLVSRIVSMSA